jgi:hypothetical protein
VDRELLVTSFPKAETNFKLDPATQDRPLVLKIQKVGKVVKKRATRKLRLNNAHQASGDLRLQVVPQSKRDRTIQSKTQCYSRKKWKWKK